MNVWGWVGMIAIDLAGAGMAACVRERGDGERTKSGRRGGPCNNTS